MNPTNPLGRSISGVKILGYETVPTDKLKKTTTNNRVEIPEDSSISLIIESVKTMGVTEPIIVNEDYEVISGQIRLYSAIKAGLKEVPIVKCKFADKYHERIVSLLTDTTHTPLSDKDKYNFVQRALEEDKQSVEQISLDVGIHPATVRAWYNWGKAPQVIQYIEETTEDKPETKKILDKYMETGQRKKTTLNRILKDPQFKDNPKKSLDLIKASTQVELGVTPIPERGLLDIEKEASHGINVDIEEHKQVYQSNTQLMNLRIPEQLHTDFLAKCKTLHKAPYKVINNLIREWLKTQ